MSSEMQGHFDEDVINIAFDSIIIHQNNLSVLQQEDITTLVHHSVDKKEASVL